MFNCKLSSIFVTLSVKIVTRHHLLWQSCKCIEMLLPVTCIDTCVGNRIPAVDHHSISHIDAYVRCAACIIGPLEKDQVARLCLFSGHRRTHSQKSVRGQPAYIPAYTAVIDHPADIAGTVKGCGRICSSPHIVMAILHDSALWPCPYATSAVSSGSCSGSDAPAVSCPNASAFSEPVGSPASILSYSSGASGSSDSSSVDPSVSPDQKF